MHFFCRENPKNYAVAVVDSGIIRHPDLERQVIAFYDFSNENSTSSSTLPFFMKEMNLKTVTTTLTARL